MRRVGDTDLFHRVLRVAALIIPTVVAAYLTRAPWVWHIDWWIFQDAAELGWNAYEWDGGMTGPLTGPLTLGLAILISGAAATMLTVLLLPLTLARARLSATPTLLAGLAVAPMWGGLAAWQHLDDAAAVALLVEARNHRGWRRGLLIGLAVAFKPWAVAGLPFLWRRDWPAILTAGAVQLAWLPFLVDVLTMPRPTVPVQPDAPLRLLLGEGVVPGAGMRAVQFAAVIAVAAWCIRRGRSDAAIVAALSVRVLLDAGDFDYYVGSIGLAALAMRRHRWTVLALLNAQWIILMQEAPSTVSPIATAAIGTAVVALSLRSADPEPVDRELGAVPRVGVAGDHQPVRGEEAGRVMR